MCVCVWMMDAGAPLLCVDATPWRLPSHIHINTYTHTTSPNKQPGFQTARTLAIKFVTLYQLASELLSKQVRTYLRLLTSVNDVWMNKRHPPSKPTPQ